jgi:AcrR family transcriptional regulator
LGNIGFRPGDDGVAAGLVSPADDDERAVVGECLRDGDAETPVEPVTSAVRPDSRVSFGLMSPYASPLEMDLQVQKLTAKGRATRQRIIEGAAAEIRARGVALTTLEDVMARTQTSKSQLFHYFPGGKDQLLLAVAAFESQMVIDDQQPHLGALTSWAAWQRWRNAVVERYHRQGQNCPIAVLMSEIGRTTPGAQAVTAELMVKWHGAIAAGIRSMQEQGKVAALVDADRAAAALLAGIQGGVGIMLATGDLSYLEAALDEGIGALRDS